MYMYFPLFKKKKIQNMTKLVNIIHKISDLHNVTETRDLSIC